MFIVFSIVFSINRHFRHDIAVLVLVVIVTRHLGSFFLSSGNLLNLDCHHVNLGFFLVPKSFLLIIITD